MKRTEKLIAAGRYSIWIIDFIIKDYGSTYNLTIFDRLNIIIRFLKVHFGIYGGPGLPYFLILAIEILSISKKHRGDLIECGSYKGKSTCFLSIIAQTVGRKLWVCDSFRGLPQENNMIYLGKYQGTKVEYAKGDFKGTLDEVKTNLKKYGEISMCNFVKGYFNKSLKTISGNKYVFAFTDVDLVSSTKDVLLYLWPRMKDDTKIYNDDMGVVEIEKIYFDDQWWNKYLKVTAPGVVGSGSGIKGFPSLGYCLKKTNFDNFITYKGAKN